MTATLEERQAMPPAPPTIACGKGAVSARAEERGNRPQRLAGLLWRVSKNAHSHRDPLFDRPDLIEDDYYRFRNYPSG